MKHVVCFIVVLFYVMLSGCQSSGNQPNTAQPTTNNAEQPSKPVEMRNRAGATTAGCDRHLKSKPCSAPQLSGNRFT